MLNIPHNNQMSVYTYMYYKGAYML